MEKKNSFIFPPWALQTEHGTEPIEGDDVFLKSCISGNYIVTENDIYEGCIVVLKTESNFMVSSGVDKNGNITCYWFDKENNPHKDIFNSDSIFVMELIPE